MNVAPFDAYEIAPVVCAADGNCEQYDTLLAAQEAMSKGDELVWSVYGHCPEGGVEWISDFGDEDGATTLIYRITGKIVPLCNGAQIVNIGPLAGDVQSVAARVNGSGKSRKLDDLVHDVASGLGSDANNGGVDGQVRFLMQHGVNAAEVLRTVGLLH